jgi:F-type H+-transporting ATPase subunit gamma
VEEYKELMAKVSFDKVQQAARFAMAAFAEGTYDRVEIVYNEFKNVATQILNVEQYLPVVQEQKEDDSFQSMGIDYIYQPNQEEIVRDLIPMSLEVQLFKAILESNASEHGARMTAMDKATENAGELLKELKLTYNRTRQAAITKEILEIVGGAEALG